MKKAYLLGFLPVFLLSTQVFAQSKTEIIPIDGKEIRIKTSGLEQRKAHQPIVILEAGSGESLEIWNRVFDQIADFSPVLSYDRLGLGKSTASKENPTLETRVKALEALLAETKIQPPYILAGNTWGNLLIREFAENHPSEVEGMIYVDPILDIENTTQLSAYLSENGLDGEQLVSEYMDFQNLSMTNRSKGNTQEAELFLTILEENKLIWSSQAVPEVSSLVILGSRFNAFPMMGSLSENSGEFFNLLIESKKKFLDEYTTLHPEYSVLLSSGSMNSLLLQEPTQIAQSVRQVLYADPNKKIMNAAHKLSPEEFDTFISDLFSYMPGSLLTEENINMLGYSLMRFDKYKQALSLFQQNLENHPDSPNVYDSMGEGLVALGRVEEAVPLFKKAVELGAEPRHRDFELFKKNLIKGEAMLADGK
ncbi:alpha/beta fold hydrolase [Algoriphagus winogradskyi]|uniref:Alpha/beta hydrolase fold n=1 Tax=Algoriphagus winogradskyi TaxID=237017 RepID=A0ABY1PJB3_9BACT|nr:alpha/beta fold hydrolase [Algoriphagus winogradskyi]SMP35303.1 alpha/beta hydrolase fold [Algoriphagus winogradskyi]